MGRGPWERRLQVGTTYDAVGSVAAYRASLRTGGDVLAVEQTELGRVRAARRDRS